MKQSWMESQAPCVKVGLNGPNGVDSKDVDQGGLATSWHTKDIEVPSPLLPHFCACRW